MSSIDAPSRRSPSGLGRASRHLEEGEPLSALEAVVEGLREGSREEAPARVRSLIASLEERPDLARTLGRALRSLVSERRLLTTLTESGVPSTSGFFSEVAGRILTRLLPELEDEADLRTLVRHLFPEEDDHLWIAAVPTETWTALLSALGLRAETVQGIAPELASAIRVLAHHVSSLGLQPDVTHRLPHLGSEESPFLRLSDAVLRYIRSFDDDVQGNEDLLLEEALDTVARCRAEVERLREEKARHGTSLHLTGLSYRLLRLLDRLELLLHLTEPVQGDFQGSAVTLFQEIVRAENTRHHVLPVIRERADLLALRVVEHAARKGSKYITTGRHDYARFFVSSLGGGLIVAVFALLKVVMEQWSVPLAVQALLYGVNYTICFVLIYLTGSALATKQPAMTANTVARALGEADDRHMADLVELVVRVWRSQFVSFAGNLLMAFPVAFLLSELFLMLTGELVADRETAVGMVSELHPWQSGTVLYAAVAGVCLFAAGLLSGWVENRNVHRSIPGRVAAHPGLVRVFGERRSRAMGDFIDANLGMLTGNAFLGFALGSMGTLGEILGLPLDIRHVAFASAHFGTALEVLDLQLAWSIAWPVAVGVALIGLINFLVSFGLSLATALESRRVTWVEVRVLASLLGRRAWSVPLDWFVPPRER